LERTPHFKRPIITINGEEEASLEWIDFLIRLLVALLTAVVGSSGFGVAVPVDTDTFHSPTIIEGVEVMVLESSPMQVNLAVRGAQPDGCEFPVIVEQRREGNTIIVEIYRDMPISLICAAVLLPYRETIALEGSFEPGTYTFRVNDYVVEQDL
jgi:hypothetical protein